ncbi:Rpn family recombination-promoting nuclease/putative transposase [Thiotrichales bacterium 19S9-12]|nr:Rpn family recombination-promoting nuclease/putative transposase [Thiotrichales bacterium 19S9-11]MCF6812581.1 Rpn family recombination-promoting nuclease/putative transposase [Thiotrichales bacterium 19S9-12]
MSTKSREHQLITDVLWSVPVKGKKAYIYFLCEHESNLKNHAILPFRFHKYVIRIMEKHLNKGNDRLPIVIPILLYHGTKQGYPHSVSIFDCFENKELAQKYAFQDIKLIDLTVMDDETIASQGFRFFFQLVLKYSRDKELAKRLVDVLERHPELRHYFDKKDFKKAFVQLLISLDLDSKKTAKATLKKLDSLTGANIMTLREQWENEATRKGMKKGIEQGAIATARSMLADNMPISTISKYTGLEKSTILALKKDIENK